MFYIVQRNHSIGLSKRSESRSCADSSRRFEFFINLIKPQISIRLADFWNTTYKVGASGLLPKSHIIATIIFYNQKFFSETKEEGTFKEKRK